MAMSVGSGDGEDDRPMSDINTTPLVDVMLVLLIIFLITVPVVIQTVPLQLPQVVTESTTPTPENAALSVREVNEIGRASRRERVCTYGYVVVSAVPLENKQKYR